MSSLKNAGTFIAATFSKTPEELRAALKAPDGPAKYHGIPVAWGVEYLKRELSSRG